jgi:hypothetical protein
MSLLRPRSVPPTSVPLSSAHERIAALEIEIKALRPSRPPHLPAPVVVADRSEKVLFLLTEKALHEVSVALPDDARRTVAEALRVLDEVTAEPAIARACVLLGEVLLVLDAPQHALPRLQRAVAIFDRYRGDGRSAIRARVALGRALVALDDIVGLDVLNQARRACEALGETPTIALIDRELREAEKTFDTPRHVHTGYGRPVSEAPPAEPIR